MRVGLVDYDLIERPQLGVINIELLKIGKYYESYGHEVQSVTPHDNIFSFDKIIVGSTRIGNLTKMKNVAQHPNIEYIGAAFNNWNYIPTGVAEIDEQPVDPIYYRDIISYQIGNGYGPAVENLFKKKWERLYPNAKHIQLSKILTGEKFNLVDNYFFDKEDWEITLRNLSIYNSYFTFVNPLVIKNGDDLKNFIKVKEMGFKKLFGAIIIPNLNEFKQFCQDNKEQLNMYSNILHYVIAYDPNNIYSEQFYYDEIINTLQKIKILNESGIEVKQPGTRIDYSKFIFNSLVFESLKYFIETKMNNEKTFHQVFLFTNRQKTDIIKSYYHFMNTHQQYYYLFSRKFKKEGV